MSTAQRVTTRNASPDAVTVGGPPRILIVGGGFAGMYTARHLRRRLRRGEAVVTLVDPRGFMTFQPLLSEAAAGTIEPRHAVTSLRRALPGAEVLTGRVTGIDHGARRAFFQPRDGTGYMLRYDVLVLAAGSVSRTLPIAGLAETAAGFKSLAEAIHLRNHVLAQLDSAASVQDPQERRRALTFVVVGGGFAGVEAVAGLQAMAERASRYYPSLSPHQMRWVLVEATSRILPDLDPALGQWTVRVLGARGILVRLGTRLVSAEGGHLVLDDGTELDAGTLVWTVGGTANALASASDLPLDEAGRVRATEYLSVTGVPGAYAAGDGAAVPDLTRPGAICGPNAQHAVRQAKTLARNIAAGLRGRPLRPYRHRYLGSLATLGRHQGVAQVYRLRLHGSLAWLIARGYHLITVPTLNHKVRILADWALSIFFRADTIPLTDLEYPGPELIPRSAASNPRGTTAEARSPGHRPAHRAEPVDDGRPAPTAAAYVSGPSDLGPRGGLAVKRLAAGTRRLGRGVLRRDPGDRWAAVFGRIAGYSFAVAVVTGVLLLPFFRASMATVVYHGSYRLLDGVPMSQAYQSVLATSFGVRGGLLIRQVHHWSADVFVAAICLRLLRVFFRGRFSGRALPGWLIWVALLPVGMLAAYTGTLLPDDGLSGGSLSVITGVLLSVPVIGTHLVFWIFGGAPPGHQIISRDYWVHILVLPALAGALLLLSSRPSLRWPRRVRPDPLLLFTCAVLVLLGTLAQVNPVWLIGPYQPGAISAGAVPDWYMGFLDGALRLMPAWQIDVAGHPLTLSVLVPAVLVPGAFFTVLAAYPLLDRRLTGGQGLHHVLDHPRGAATRTGVGAAGITFYGLLWAAAANDQIAYHLHLDLYAVTWFFRIAVLAGPPLAYTLTQRIFLGLTRRDRDEAEHGRPGRIVMNPDGGYSEISEPVRPIREEGQGPGLLMAAGMPAQSQR